MSEPRDATAASNPKVALFVTCLVDLMRPSVGFAAIKLLEAAGFRVEVPTAQTCCGQPAYNSGDLADTRDIALSVIEAFADYDVVVIPSGSCGGMIKDHYPRLFEPGSEDHQRAAKLADKTHELMSFLDGVAGDWECRSEYRGTATYHDSCAGLRELGIKDQPRRLLSKVDGLQLVEGKEAETCCGFGGLFCVKYPEISEKITDAKVDDVLATGADTLIGGDLGCLMNMAGRLHRRGWNIKVRHTAEILAGTADECPPIGEGTPKT